VRVVAGKSVEEGVVGAAAQIRLGLLIVFLVGIIVTELILPVVARDVPVKGDPI
jgi:hypothetical protein